MKKLNPIYFIMIVMLLAGLFLVGRSAYRIYSRKPLVEKTGEAELDKEAQKRMAEVRSLDIGILEQSAEKPPAEVAKSLRRLQRQSKDDAPQYIKQFISSDNEVIRAAALEAAAALGLAEFEAPVQAGIDSQNSEIRRSVIKGLGQQSSEFSRSLVEGHWARGIQEPKEKFVTLLSLQRIAASQEERTKWQGRLVQELRAYKGKEAPKEWVDAFSSLPASPELIDSAWNIVRNAQPNEVSFRALLYLRDFAGPQALKSDLNSISVPAHRRFQLALIDLIFDHCPNGWNSLVKKIMSSDPHPMVKKGLEEAELSVKCI